MFLLKEQWDYRINHVKANKKALRAGRVQSLICQLALLELAPVPSEWLLQLPWANPSAALDDVLLSGTIIHLLMGECNL